ALFPTWLRSSLAWEGRRCYTNNTTAAGALAVAILAGLGGPALPIALKSQQLLKKLRSSLAWEGRRCP
ncbi:hypothetical protein, partial [Amycolatopsis cihanbeyliensis]